MADRLVIEKQEITVTTEEGRTLVHPESALVEMFRQELLAPLDGEALPDGIKFVRWQNPHLMVVHQLPPHVRRLRWITDDSPADYGPGTQYRNVRVSLPYAITFAIFVYCGKALHLSGANELYFRNEPLRLQTDGLGFPALLNISHIKTSNRTRSWICTQHLKQSSGMSWPAQLEALLDHTFNGAFNRSSERHEGASMYGFSKGIHPDLHPVEQWEKATTANEAFALQVPWQPVPHNVGELMEIMCAEQGHDPHMRILGKPAPQRDRSLTARFLNFARNGRAKK